MADHSGRTTSSMPNWLRPMNRESQPYLPGPARFAASTSVQSSFSNHDYIHPQHHPSSPHYEPEHSATDVISTPLIPALVSGAAKRKAHDGVPSDEEQRDCHSRYISTHLTGKGCVEASEGSTIWIEESEAPTSLKNPMQRVTALGGEIHSKRARTATIDFDGEFFRFLVPLFVVLIISRAQTQRPSLRGEGKLWGCYHHMCHCLRLEIRRESILTWRCAVSRQHKMK